MYNNFVMGFDVSFNLFALFVNVINLPYALFCIDLNIEIHLILMFLKCFTLMALS
jgi:hypothetical protein